MRSVGWKRSCLPGSARLFAASVAIGTGGSGNGPSTHLAGDRTSPEMFPRPVCEPYAGPLNPVFAPASPVYLAAKRGLDIFGSLIGLIVLSPLFLLLYVLVRLDSPGFGFHRRRVLARQSLDGGAVETFDAFKFRTMVVNADQLLESRPELMREYRKAYKLRRDPRVTRIGGPLRRSSLDELPQLWNVLRGQMSLVGPRMITPPELAHYGADAARLLAVKPGLTGLWQVSGRANISYSERVRLDMLYIEHRSLWLDGEILLRTFGCVFNRRGAI
ncbi:MAG: sugar transferase [Capsulimonadales bacterium]|nr:sugar transferase [Capsulimonadales bacterium]